MKLTALSFSGFAAPLARVSPRERKLLAGLALTALLVGLFETFSWSQSALDRQMQAQQALDAALVQARGVRGGGVQGQLAQQRKAIESWSWQAASAPVGRVVAQDQVIAIAAAAGLANVEVKPIEKIDTVGGVAFVRVDVNADFSWPSFTAFLTGLAATGKGFMVDSMTVLDDAKPKLRVVLKMPVTASAEAKA